MTEAEPRKKATKAELLVKAGSGIAGGLASAACTVMTGDPFLGSVVGPSTASVIGEFGTRLLGRSERRRVGAVISFSMERFTQRLESGDSLRTDGVFDKELPSGARAQELIEGVLLAAQREHEERKVRHFGYLMANLWFEDSVDPVAGLWAMDMASRLSWTQFTLLSIVARDDRALPSMDIGVHKKTWVSFSVASELLALGLGGHGLIGAPSTKTPNAGLNKIGTDISEMQLQNGGLLLHGLLQLDEVSTDDVDETLGLLERDQEPLVDPAFGS